MTAQALLAQLVALFPAFGPYWADPGNCFREEDGSFTCHGVFAEFSGFFRDRYESLPADRLAALGALVSVWTDSPDAELSNAVASCFLENVAGERCSADLERHLTGDALRYYRRWSGLE
jgi:hypothetical protein